MFRFSSVIALVATFAPGVVRAEDSLPQGSVDCLAPTVLTPNNQPGPNFVVGDFEITIPYSDFTELKNLPEGTGALYYSLTVEQACEVIIGVSTCEAVTFDVEIDLLESCDGPVLDTAAENCAGAPPSVGAAFLDYTYDFVPDQVGPKTFTIAIKPADGVVIPTNPNGFVTLQGAVSQLPGACGDPHFYRWKQEARDSFHGECDMVLLHKEEIEEGIDLDVHIRTTIRDNYSYIEAAAMKIGEDMIEFHFDSVHVNGEKKEDEAFPIYFGNGNRIIKKDDNKRVFKVDAMDRTSVEVRSTKQFMSLKINGKPQYLNGSFGMLGEFKTGAMVARDGRILDDFQEFGFEWQVNPSDPQIFMDAREPQLPYERCRMPSVSASSRRRKLRAQNRVLYEQAVEACAKNHIPANMQSCVDDVMFTGELGLSEAF